LFLDQVNYLDTQAWKDRSQYLPGTNVVQQAENKASFFNRILFGTGIVTYLLQELHFVRQCSIQESQSESG
jgi:hypothetical protein